MLRSSQCLHRKLQANTKFPTLVSYHRLPWEQISPHSAKLHEVVAPHYVQLLALASQRAVPQLVQEAHIAIPAELQPKLLPGLTYLLPNSESGVAVLPEGWEATSVDATPSTQYYGRLHAEFAPVAGVSTMVSPDLRLYANVVRFSGVRVPFHPRSSLALITERSGSHGFALFHYYRPNRAATEVSKAFGKFYEHHPDTTVVSSLVSGNDWVPVLASPKRGRGAKVTPAAPFVPPQSYLQGLAERQALQPGNCFGRRSEMWGHWF